MARMVQTRVHKPQVHGVARIVVCAAIGMLTVAAFAGCAQPLLPETTSWPDGSPKEIWTRTVNSNGDTLHHGTYSSWYASAVLQEQGEYAHGKRVGTWTRWYDTDPATRLWEGEYVADLKEGRWVYWPDPSHAHMQPSTDTHTDGHDHHSSHVEPWPRKYAHYRAGVAHGEWISWYMNGQVADSMMYEDGHLEGLSQTFHPNGTRQSEAAYLKGALQSSIQMWDSLGNPIVTE